MRCFLFVPGDSEKKLHKSESIDVDALIIDLEDAVAPDAKPEARRLAAEFASGRDNVWVRINPMASADAAKDLATVMPSAPAGIVLPKPDSPDDVRSLSDALHRLEADNGVEVGSTRIVALCTERVRALFSLSDYRGATSRLYGLSWGAEDLSSELGASANRDSDGNWLPPYEMARSLCLFAAHNASVEAIDTVFTDFRDDQGLSRYAANAARDGFTGMLAIHPGQVDTIQAAFTPSQAALDEARQIVNLFEANPGVGALAFDGRMLDRPHYEQARKILARGAG
ncbi:MAG: CoA ester lyase [Pseudomonadota bacterium]